MSNITFCGYTQDEIKAMAAEIEQLRDQQISAVNGMLRAEQEVERLRALFGRIIGLTIHRANAIDDKNKELRAALRQIEHETGETMRAINHGRRGDIAHEIARCAREGK
jgi:copper homeostasis protein CutC